MKRKSFLIILIVIGITLNINACSKKVEDKNSSITQEDTSNSGNKVDESLSSDLEKSIKEDIDLVLSYSNGYDDTMKKHISEKNFYVCNYVEFYSLYIGDLNLNKYESEIVSIKEESGKYRVCMLLNIEAVAKENHEGHGRDEAVGENIPIEVIVKEKDNEFYIESFVEYEDLQKAKELNEGFN